MKIAKTLGTVHTHTHTHTQVFYKINKRKIGISKNTILLFILLLAILLMGIGYASINSITGEIEGTVIADVQSGVFITNIEYVSDVDANINTSKIEYYIGTMMQSTVELSDNNVASEIKYKVTVYNNSLNNYPFLDVLYDTESTEFYDNENIIFEIDPSGFKVGDIINAKETKEIYITFKYKNGIIPENTVLNSYINFRIAEPNRLVVAGDVASTGNYLGSTITKNKIEAISFKLGKEEPEGTVASFDASEKKDESIIGYYTDVDGNGLYELTFLSEEKIAANKNANDLFAQLTSLKSIEFDNFSTWGVTTMDAMFYNCSGLTTLDLSKFDTSQVTNIQGMFNACSKLTTLDVSSFDTSQVTTMRSMFYNCRGLTTLDVSCFNTSQVTDMNAMFVNCSGLTTLDLRSFNTSRVTTMKNMFNGCSGLKTLDVNSFDTSKVTNMQGMFARCSGLTTLDVSKFDTSRVTSMEIMFRSCTGLTGIDVSSFDTSKVTNMYQMFSGCSRLTTLDVSSFDTSKVTTMYDIFAYCSRLTELDLSSFDTSKVTIMQGMFYQCHKLKNIYVKQYDATTSTGWTTAAVSNDVSMFSDCTSIVGGNGTTYNSSRTNGWYARIDTAETPGYFTNILDKTEQ